MTTRERPFPPSQQRIAAAAAAGMRPQAPLLLAAPGLLIVGIMLWCGGELFAYHLAQLFVVVPDASGASLAGYLRIVSGVCLFPGAGLVILFLLYHISSAWWQRRGTGSTAVPLPEWTPPVWEPVFIGFLCAVTIGLWSLLLIRESGFHFQSFFLQPLEGLVRLFTMTGKLLTCGGGVFVLGGMVQMVLCRHHLLRALCLDRSEQKKEAAWCRRRFVASGRR